MYKHVIHPQVKNVGYAPHVHEVPITLLTRVGAKNLTLK